MFQGMVQAWWGRIVFKYWEYGFLGVCFGLGGWLVGTITKMEKAYANSYSLPPHNAQAPYPFNIFKIPHTASYNGSIYYSVVAEAQY